MRRSRHLLFSEDTQRLEYLVTPLRQLGLTIEGTFLEEAIRTARAELRQVHIDFLQPYFYLSTGYGTVTGTTSIALGFYDCNEVLRQLNKELRGFQYTEAQIVDLVRHELGHAFSYAYKLYSRKDFRHVFKVKGNYFLTYPATDRYKERANPWSRDYVNPAGDHYAQKHPDDDFAETFCVWLNPANNWREDYRNYPGALKKLEFVDGLVRELRGTEPVIDQSPRLDEPLDELRFTAARVFRLRSTRQYRQKATGYIDPDLREMFWRPPPVRANRKRERDFLHVDTFVRRHKREIVTRVSRWVGVEPVVVQDLIDKCSARARILDLWVRKDARDKKLLEFTSYVSYRCALYLLNDSYLNGR